VVIVIAAMSLRGYWRTLIVRIACNPAIRITKQPPAPATGRFDEKVSKGFHCRFSNATNRLGSDSTCGFGARSFLIVTVIPFAV